MLDILFIVGSADMKKHALDLIAQRFNMIAQLPQLQSLSKELLLEILYTLAQHERNASHDVYQDIVNDVL